MSTPPSQFTAFFTNIADTLFQNMEQTLNTWPSDLQLNRRSHALSVLTYLIAHYIANATETEEQADLVVKDMDTYIRTHLKLMTSLSRSLH